MARIVGFLVLVVFVMLAHIALAIAGPVAATGTIALGAVLIVAIEDSGR